MLQGGPCSPQPLHLSLPSPAILFLFLPYITCSLGSWVLSPWGISQWKPLCPSVVAGPFTLICQCQDPLEPTGTTRQ